MFVENIAHLKLSNYYFERFKQQVGVMVRLLKALIDYLMASFRRPREPTTMVLGTQARGLQGIIYKGNVFSYSRFTQKRLQRPSKLL